MEELARPTGAGKVVWIDVQGLGDEALLNRIQKIFLVHPLSLKGRAICEICAICG